MKEYPFPYYVPFPGEADHNDPVQKDLAREFCAQLLAHHQYNDRGASETDLIEDGLDEMLAGWAIESLMEDGAVEECGEGHDGEPRFRRVK